MKAILSQLFTSGGAEQGMRAARASSRGKGAFGQLLASLMGRSKAKPVAFVRRGREVSFEKIPFIDSSGAPLHVKTVKKAGSTPEVKIRRAGRVSQSNRISHDPSLRRELTLSRNQGVAQAIPDFRKKVRQHLRETEDLRLSILKGSIETPGNRDGILRRKLKEEARNEDVVVDAVWRDQLRSHILRTKGNGTESLRALALAMNENGGSAKPSLTQALNSASAEKGNTKADSKPAGMPELQDPTQPRIRKFQPQRIDPRNGLPIPEKPAAQPPSSSNPTTKDPSGLSARQAVESRAASPVRQGEVVDRITIHKTDDQPAQSQPISESERRTKIVQALRQGSMQSSQTAQREPAGVTSNPKAQPSATTTERGSAHVTSPGRAASTSEPPQPVEPAATRESAARQVNEKGSRAATPGKAPNLFPVIQEPKGGAATPAPTSPDGAVGESGVARMSASGWRIHTPMSAVSPTAPSRTRSGRQGQNPRTEDGRMHRAGGFSRRPSAPLNPEARKATETFNSSDKGATDLKGTSAQASVAQNEGPLDPTGKSASSMARAAQQSHPQSTPGSESMRAMTNLQEVLTKLETQARILIKGGETRIQVRLQPASLGTLAVEIRESDGRYDVTLRATTPEAARAIEQQLPVIREHLAQSGIQVEKFDIQAGQDRFNDARDDQSNRQADAQRSSGGSRMAPSQAEEREDQEPLTHRPLNTGTNTVEYVG